MDVTPSPGAFKAMEAFVNATIGEAPLAIETTTAAEQRRAMRANAFDFLHRLYGLAMREGVARLHAEYQKQPLVKPINGGRILRA